VRNARFVVDWDSTLVEDLYPEQGDWLPGAVSALHELNRHGDIIIFSCRVAPYEFPTQRNPEDDIARDPETLATTIARMQAMLDEVGLGHVEIWQRPYKPNATVYIDDKAVRFTGNWVDTLDGVYDAMNEQAGPWDILPSKGKWAGRTVADDAREESEHVLSEDCWCEPERVTVEETIPWEEVKRHPNSQAFHDRLDAWGDLHDRKQQDYGSDVDPFANIRQGAAEIGLPGWVGCAIRMRDKMQRILTAAKQYIETGEVSMANESLVDSFDDLGVYSGIGAVLLEEES
jgi:hypothetical protein